MLRKLGPALLVIVGLFSGSAASASPLTFYTDEAAWLAAVSGFTVGGYPHDVTYTDSLVNVALLPNDLCCIVSTPPPIFGLFPPVLGENFSSVNITFSAIALDDCISPSCPGLTFATDVTVDFPIPIYGFASSSAMEDGGVFINGQAFPFPFFGFFGVVGLINSLDFSCAGCLPTDDENVDLDLPGIVVATTVDEPSGFASLATGLVLLAAASSRFRRRADRLARSEL
jgi:hypothetical protein